FVDGMVRCCLFGSIHFPCLFGCYGFFPAEDHHAPRLFTSIVAFVATGSAALQVKVLESRYRDISCGRAARGFPNAEAPPTVACSRGCPTTNGVAPREQGRTPAGEDAR